MGVGLCQGGAHVLGLRQRRGLVRLRVLPSVVIWGPLLLRSHLHDGLLGLVFPVERAPLVPSRRAAGGRGLPGKPAALRYLRPAPGWRGRGASRARAQSRISAPIPASCVALSASLAHPCLCPHLAKWASNRLHLPRRYGHQPRQRT